MEQNINASQDWVMARLQLAIKFLEDMVPLVGRAIAEDIYKDCASPLYANRTLAAVEAFVKEVKHTQGGEP